MITAVVLAAGASTRYGTEPPKQVELLPKVLAALRESSVDKIVVVSGAHKVPVESVHCPDWERGPGASLRCGLVSLPPEERLKVRDALVKHLDLIDAFVKENPYKLDPDELGIVRSAHDDDLVYGALPQGGEHLR